MDKVFERLGALTHIELRLGQFESSLKSVNTEVSGLKKKIDEFESSASFMSEKLDEISKNSKDFSDRIQTISKGTESIRSENIALKANIRGLKEEMENVKERQIELQARSMRENLIFHGIDESAEGEVEDCEEKIKPFIQDKLQVTKTLEFHRVHRLGKRQPGRTRGMIAKFVNYKDRELVRRILFDCDHGNSENIKKFLNEYKVGKAYEYLQSIFVKEIFYHPISAASEICYLRAKCTPSQRLRDADHTMWIMVRKVSGDIVSAFCSCTAGLGQTCNHIAAMLFRIDAANKMGLSSCTSIPCQWIIPTETKTLPVRIKDLTVKKSRASTEECGLFLDKNYSYLAASLDMLVNCKCCGNGLLEVKCAMVPKCDVCKGFCACNVPDYLKFDNHVFVLKKNHKYFCQIQGQMAITGRKWCDLCVYTCNGTHVQRVHFDDTYFANVTRQLVHFFNKFIAVEYM
ncbi:hypothetical protein FSP39_023080 [Pinctada imbricata]|uniref:SWIM-type domain-containing protein n=1 Tax=Pinctada imbricata TaxID=66713 RepID=A0AA88YP88_PINIB|nr:hypothetical protein FSP39_023080 [Pinctada imbricata]